MSRAEARREEEERCWNSVEEEEEGEKEGSGRPVISVLQYLKKKQREVEEIQTYLTDEFDVIER